LIPAKPAPQPEDSEAEDQDASSSNSSSLWALQLTAKTLAPQTLAFSRETLTQVARWRCNSDQTYDTGLVDPWLMVWESANSLASEVTAGIEPAMKVLQTLAKRCGPTRGRTSSGAVERATKDVRQVAERRSRGRGRAGGMTSRRTRFCQNRKLYG